MVRGFRMKSCWNWIWSRQGQRQNDSIDPGCTSSMRTSEPVRPQLKLVCQANSDDSEETTFGKWPCQRFSLPLGDWHTWHNLTNFTFNCRTIFTEMMSSITQTTNSRTFDHSPIFPKHFDKNRKAFIIIVANKKKTLSRFWWGDARRDESMRTFEWCLGRHACFHVIKRTKQMRPSTSLLTSQWYSSVTNRF